MPFLVKADLSTHLYAEVLEEISRGDDTIIARAISAAVSEVKSYLSRFDLVKLFGDDSTDPVTAKEVSSEHLMNIVKDVACWHIIKLANPNIDMTLFRTLYDDAIKFLEKVMKGQADPEGWPYRPDDATTPANENFGIQYSANRKKIQHY